MNTAVDKSIPNNSVELISNQQYVLNSEVIDNEELVEAISDLINIYIMCSKLEDSEQVDIIKRIWFLTNKWVETIGSLKYIPGLISELAESIKTKLWNINIDYELLREVFVKTYLMRRVYKISVKDISEYRELVYKLLVNLGYSGGSLFINNLINSNDPENLISLVVLSIILCTNIEQSFFD